MPILDLLLILLGFLFMLVIFAAVIALAATGAHPSVRIAERLGAALHERQQRQKRAQKPAEPQQPPETGAPDSP